MGKKLLLGVCLLVAPVLTISVRPAHSDPPPTEWAVRYNGPDNGLDEAQDLAVDGLGNVYITGASDGVGSDADYATIKLDTDGNQVWLARYNGPANGHDEARKIALDGAGNLYVCGLSYGEGTSADITTIKYDANGNPLWVRRFNGPANGYDQPNDMAVSASGYVHITGQSPAEAPDCGYVTLQYDPDGNLMWEARWVGEFSSAGYGTALALDPVGNVLVTGMNFIVPDEHAVYATAKYTSGGTELWLSHYSSGPTYEDIAFAIAVDKAGNAYVSGRSGPYGDQDYATIMYDANGSEQWVARYQGPGGCSDQAQDIAVDDGGNVYVTGFACTGGSPPYEVYDCATIRYDSSGTELWVAQYGELRAVCNAIVLDETPAAYVTGGSYRAGQSEPDYATIKYDAAGNEVWVAFYDGPDPDYNLDQAFAIALDNASNVYVTGSSRTPPSSSSADYATVKYSQGDSPWPTTSVVLTNRYPPRTLESSDLANAIMLLFCPAAMLAFVAARSRPGPRKERARGWHPPRK